MCITSELLAWTRLWSKKRGSSKCLFFHCLGLPQGRALQDGALLYASVEQGVEKSQGAEKGKRIKTWDPTAAPSRCQWKRGPIVVLPVHPSKVYVYHQTWLSRSPDVFWSWQLSEMPCALSPSLIPEPNSLSLCVMTMAHHSREDGDSPSARRAAKGWYLLCRCF